MDYSVTDSPPEARKSEVYQKLLSFNRAHLGDCAPRDLCVFLEDGGGDLTAGLVGETFGSWLEVHYLWVNESARGYGVGTELLRQAEAAAAERGCRFVFLNTFSFQAPGFYEKLGYAERFALVDYPVSGKRFYYTKELS